LGIITVADTAFTHMMTSKRWGYGLKEFCNGIRGYVPGQLLYSICFVLPTFDVCLSPRPSTSPVWVMEGSTPVGGETYEFQFILHEEGVDFGFPRN